MKTKIEINKYEYSIYRKSDEWKVLFQNRLWKENKFNEIRIFMILRGVFRNNEDFF